MRVTGGTLCRREIRVPKAEVRPTQDKVRAALFNMLGESVVGARVLDLFAGSGAVGIEAWSRGASYVCWVESDWRILPTLKENVSTLCRGDGGATQIRQIDAVAFVTKGWTGKPFDMILADPPYDRDAEFRWLERVLMGVEVSGILPVGGLLVFERSAEEGAPERAGWELLRDRTYGKTRLLILRRELGPEKETV